MSTRLDLSHVEELCTRNGFAVNAVGRDVSAFKKDGFTLYSYDRRGLQGHCYITFDPAEMRRALAVLDASHLMYKHFQSLSPHPSANGYVSHRLSEVYVHYVHGFVFYGQPDQGHREFLFGQLLSVFPEIDVQEDIDSEIEARSGLACSSFFSMRAYIRQHEGYLRDLIKNRRDQLCDIAIQLHGIRLYFAAVQDK